MKKQRTRHRDPSERALTLERYRTSGVTQRDFCEREGISISALQSWLRTSSSSARFTEVPIAKTRTTVELVFPDGTALRIRGE